jgi:lipid-A-disaccharide synthase-like uncharacterized protein
MTYNLVGVVGLIILAIAWIPQTLETIKKRKSYLSVRFALLYLSGSLVLAIYSVMINDTVFLILNIVLIIMAVINLYIEFFVEKHKRGWIKKEVI